MTLDEIKLKIVKTMSVEDCNEQDLHARAWQDQIKDVMSQLKKSVHSQCTRIEELKMIILVLRDEHNEKIEQLQRKMDDQAKYLQGRIRSLEKEVYRVKVTGGADPVEGNVSVPMADLSDEINESSENAKSDEEYKVLSDCKYRWGKTVRPESTPTPTEDPDE